MFLHTVFQKSDKIDTYKKQLVFREIDNTELLMNIFSKHPISTERV